MTFEEYLKAVFNYYMLGGVTWDGSYWRVLVKHKPELAEKLVANHQNVTAPYVQLGDFLHSAYINWEK